MLNLLLAVLLLELGSGLQGVLIPIHGELGGFRRRLDQDADRHAVTHAPHETAICCVPISIGWVYSFLEVGIDPTAVGPVLDL